MTETTDRSADTNQIKDGENGQALAQENQRLTNRNAALTSIIDNAPIPMFAIDRDHKVIHFNRAMEELTGMSADRMLGTRDLWKAFYKKKRPVMADLIVDCPDDTPSHSVIIEHYGSKYHPAEDGSGRYAATSFFKNLGPSGKWLYFTACAFRDDTGQVAGAVETLQDVTEEKIAQTKTQKLFRIYNRILEFIPYPVVVYDAQGHVSYSNQAFTTTFGWSLEEIQGRPLPFVPEDRKAETLAMVDRLAENKSLTRYETQRLTRDNELLDVVIWAAIHERFKTGETENFVILRDVTREKRLQADNEAIMRISAALPEHPGLEDLMNYITREVKQLLNVEGAIVLLHDEIRDELFYIGGSYDNQATQKRAEQYRFPVDSLAAGKIIRTGEYLLENDPEKMKKEYPGRDEKLGYKTHSLLEVPIKSEGRIIGVLCAINKKQNLFDESDLDRMVMIAATCAISIENARFSDALQEAYRDVASMNRAKGKAINHLSHELKTPVAVLTGSLKILKKKLAPFPQVNVRATLDRIERNLNRIVEIQDEVADIMDDKSYSARRQMLHMLDACADELETLVGRAISQLPPDKSAPPGAASSVLKTLEEDVAGMIDSKFGPRSITLTALDFKPFVLDLYSRLEPGFADRDIEIRLALYTGLPSLVLPLEILEKMVTGLIRNAIENTPDKGRIDILAQPKGSGILFTVHDFGVGIVADARKRIFEGFFTTQDTLHYSTKNPFAFNAGGKGADLLRMKIFSERYGFTLEMESQRCRFLKTDPAVQCPGDIEKCGFCKSEKDCLNSGFSIFSIFLPGEMGQKTL